ncbi:hypothetical protein BJV78DRAFT_1160957 [Lactifluus subvellereus]|nr:hypothetical protein BJV78DRAFT_1160957 [Lactifluus subvellereus]
MARARLSVADVLHRGVVLSLIGVCVWGIGTGILVHRDTLRMGRGPCKSSLLAPAKVNPNYDIVPLHHFTCRGMKGVWMDIVQDVLTDSELDHRAA